MMFTDEQRAQIRAAMMADRARAPAPTRVEIVNQPQEREEKDLSPALAAIAEAVGGVNAKEVADVLSKGLAAMQKAHAAGVVEIVRAIGAIPKPYKPESYDMKPIIDAISKNTAALNKIATIVSAPKTLIFDDDDDTKIIGVQAELRN